MPELEKIFEKYPNHRREDLIPVLHDVQNAFGYISEELINSIGSYLDISINKIYGVATFYDNFCFGPKGKYHIRLCNGTACHVGGSSNLVEEVSKKLRLKHGETDKEGLFSLEVVSCIGACGLAPLIDINGEYHNIASVEMLNDIFNSYREKDNSEYDK